MLLRRLHVLPAWNRLINQFISSSLQAIPSIILTPPSVGAGQGGVPSSAGERDIKRQVRLFGNNLHTHTNCLLQTLFS